MSFQIFNSKKIFMKRVVKMFQKNLQTL